MKVIGLTGGIGSGKSTVSRFLAELGAVAIDADRVGHEVLKSDAGAQQEVVATFGKHILTPDGEIDRQRLGELVFGDTEALMRLNQIMHPRIYDRVQAQLDEYRRQKAKVMVIEAPLLIEAGWAKQVDQVWVTVASHYTVLQRLERNGLARPKALARIHSQLPSSERIKHAHMVIDTDCSLDELKAKVERLWRRVQK